MDSDASALSKKILKIIFYRILSKIYLLAMLYLIVVDGLCAICDTQHMLVYFTDLTPFPMKTIPPPKTMKTNRAIPHIGPLVTTGLFILASCAAPTNASRTPVAFRGNSSLSDAIYHDVNAIRNTTGSGNLNRHAGLDKLAMDHCEYLRQNRGSFSLYGKNVSHIGSDARSVVAMRVYNMINCSENVAWTITGLSDVATSRAILKLWQDSSKHRDAMLDDHWTHTGVGAVVDADGSVFATQIFAKKSNSLMSAQNRFNQF